MLILKIIELILLALNDVLPTRSHQHRKGVLFMLYLPTLVTHGKLNKYVNKNIFPILLYILKMMCLHAYTINTLK